MTKTILEEFVNICASCWNEHDLVCKLYNYLGKRIAAPIEQGLVDPKSIAKPCSISLKKVRAGSKQQTLIKSMLRDGGSFIFEKIHIRQVAIYPEDGDKDWSLCDILTQSCNGREHVVKIKFDIMKEILTILRGKFSQGVCEVIEALIWGEFYPDRFTPDDFAKMAGAKPEKYKPASFAKVMKRFLQGDWLMEEETKTRKRPAAEEAAPVAAKKPRQPRKAVTKSTAAPKENKLKQARVTSFSSPPAGKVLKPKKDIPPPKTATQTVIQEFMVPTKPKGKVLKPRKPAPAPETIQTAMTDFIHLWGKAGGTFRAVLLGQNDKHAGNHSGSD